MTLLSYVIPSFQASASAIATCQRLVKVEMPAGFESEIIVVDDGSADGSSERLGRELPLARILSLPRNVGRGQAINEGVAISLGEWLLILDCDCEPVDSQLALQHLHALSSNQVSLGRIVGNTPGFWGAYFDCASDRRSNLPASSASLTTANMCIAKTLFTRIGGFDPAFRKYGFEDRDFLIRARSIGAELIYTRTAAVLHSDTAVNLHAVRKKMREAGQFSAETFRASHPEAYRTLGYARVDVNTSPMAARFMACLDQIIGPAEAQIEYLLSTTLVPFAARRALATLATGASYAAGTIEAKRQNPK